MSPTEITFAVIGGMLGYVGVAAFLKGFLAPLTEWEPIDDLMFAIFWPVSWIFLIKYPGKWLGGKLKCSLEERAEEKEKQERIRIAEEKKQRIEIEKIEKELEDEERLFRNVSRKSR